MNARGGVGMVALVALVATAAFGAEEFSVVERSVPELKSVFATVQSTNVIAARARNAGTVTELAVTEGDRVAEGKAVAMIADEKLVLGLRTVDARLAEARARVAQAQTDLGRAEQLRASGVTAQARLDDVRTALTVAENQARTIEAERNVLVRQVAEGAVLAPSNGRVLQVPVTNGTVVLPGETVARIAVETYVLRAEVPERHARHLAVGDVVNIGARGGDPDAPSLGTGKIRKVYPELSQGRVVVDIDAAGLDQFLVGERVRVTVGAGQRPAMMVPAPFVENRSGVDIVRVREAKGRIAEVVVQRARELSPRGDVEILTGLKAGDVLVRP